MHWTERRRATANLGLALRARGWTLYGFHEDRSDPMTDYYSPASWHGVAEKDGYVVVVDISAGSSQLKRSSDWPKCHANPARKLWHVEKDSHVLTSGIGLGPCADYDQKRATAAAEQIVSRIEAAIAGNGRQTTTDSSVPLNVDDVTIRHNLEQQGIEVVFAAKPVEEIRAELKRLGFRWSQRQGLWYARYSDQLWQEIHKLLNCNGDDTEPEPKVTIEDLTWTQGENDAPQTYWHYRDSHGRLWSAIHHTGRPDLAWFGMVEDRDGATRLLTSCTDHGAYEERDILYGEADPGDVDPPLRLLTAMSRLILTDIDPHTIPRRRTDKPSAESLETKNPAEMTQPEILVEALRIDTLIRTSDHGFPAEIAERMESLRAAMFHLDPAVNLDAELRLLRAYDVPKLVCQWKDLTRRLERGHSMPSSSRAAATTKHAHLGKLAQSRDQVLETLRIVIHQAQDQGDPIPSAIQAEPELARILCGEPEPHPEIAEARKPNDLHGAGVGLDWPVPLHARKELHRRGWEPLYDEDETGRVEAWLCPGDQDYDQVITQVYNLNPDDEGPVVRVFTWPRPAITARPDLPPAPTIVVRRAAIEWSAAGHLQARDLDSGEVYVPPSPQPKCSPTQPTNPSLQLALF